MAQQLFSRTSIEYELALEFIGGLIAYYSEVVAVQRCKPDPDEEVILHAQREKKHLRALRDDLDPNDIGQIEDIFRRHGQLSQAIADL